MTHGSISQPMFFFSFVAQCLSWQCLHSSTAPMHVHLLLIHVPFQLQPLYDVVHIASSSCVLIVTLSPTSPLARSLSIECRPTTAEQVESSPQYQQGESHPCTSLLFFLPTVTSEGQTPLPKDQGRLSSTSIKYGLSWLQAITNHAMYGGTMDLWQTFSAP